jgi:Bacterial regulatory protein, Fis family/Transposase IS66 family
MTNNAAERALRGLALGRKARLFARSDRGSERAAIMLTRAPQRRRSQGLARRRLQTHRRNTAVPPARTAPVGVGRKCPNGSGRLNRRHHHRRRRLSRARECRGTDRMLTMMWARMGTLIHRINVALRASQNYGPNHEHYRVIDGLRARNPELAKLSIQRSSHIHRGSGPVGQPSLGINDAALARLRTYGWPGNIRELENVLETAAIMSGGVIIDEAALPSRIVDLKGESVELVDHGTCLRDFVRPTLASKPVDQSRAILCENPALRGFLFESPASQVSVQTGAGKSQQLGDEECSFRDLEATAIRNALQKHNCNISEASRSLGISRSSIYRKMRGSGIIKTSLIS